MKKEKIETPRYSPNLVWSKAHAFDRFDKLLLQELDENARKSLAEISRKVGLSRDAVRERIKKLVDKKVFLAFKPIYNPP